MEAAELRKLLSGLAVSLAVLSLAGSSQAQEAGRWAIGGSFALNSPVNFKDYMGTVVKYGFTFSYVVSPRVTVEAEYQRMSDDTAGLENNDFLWFIDNRRYIDPDVDHNFDWNIVAVNSIVRLGNRPMLTAEQWNPYITVGGGFYRYNSEVTNLIWPGQALAVPSATVGTSLGIIDAGNPTGLGPDDALEFPLQRDRRSALSLNVGVGLEAFIISNVSLDMRARYHMSVGDLRPYNDWGMYQTFPLQQFDVGAGIKFYFSAQ
jgi:opacity protein-like surface antigen